LLPLGRGGFAGNDEFASNGGGSRRGAGLDAEVVENMGGMLTCSKGELERLDDD
jgi:hypothetical protein